MYIHIEYSFGTYEELICTPSNMTSWEYMKYLAINEAEEASAANNNAEIGIQFYKDKNRIVLHYTYDDEYCYYYLSNKKESENEQCV